MESINSKIQQKNICQFCQSKIKSGEDFITCPSCASSYHIECWYENKGCAVYGCNFKIYEEEYAHKSYNVENILINAEYFINRKQYSEAINECNRIINIYPDEIEAKKLYNKAITFLNVRLKILADADEAFKRKDYTAAENYYKNALIYISDSEHSSVNTKLQAIKDAIPAMKKKVLYRNTLVYTITVLIFIFVVYLAYYYIYLEEDREFYAIERDDNTENVLSMESQIFRYENFARKYDNGKFRIKAYEKITSLAATIIRSVYKDDWKTALKYLNKIDEKSNPKLKSDLFGSLYKVAETEFTKLKSTAKHFNTQKKFIEAKNETERALSVISFFPGTEMEKDRLNLSSNLNLLNKKISYQVKYKDIEKELNEKLDELKRVKENETGNLVKINAIIIEEKSPTYFLAKNIFDNNLIALKTNDITYYKKGDVVILECRKNGKVNITDDKAGDLSVPLYKFGAAQKDYNNSGSYDLESLVQRLDYLRTQKNKIDSLLSLGI